MILGAVRKNVPMFGRIFKKLVWTKTKQITDKASKYNGCTAFSRALVLFTWESKIVVSNLSSHLFSMHYNSSHFVPTSLFSRRLRLHLRQLRNTPPPWFKRAYKSIQLRLLLTANKDNLISPVKTKYQSEAAGCGKQFQLGKCVS